MNFLEINRRVFDEYFEFRKLKSELLSSLCQPDPYWMGREGQTGTFNVPVRSKTIQTSVQIKLTTLSTFLSRRRQAQRLHKQLFSKTSFFAIREGRSFSICLCNNYKDVNLIPSVIFSNYTTVLFKIHKNFMQSKGSKAHFSFDKEHRRSVMPLKKNEILSAKMRFKKIMGVTTFAYGL